MAEIDDQLLDFVDLENEYYLEGYNQGVKDGQVAGMVEGKIFGIEKGYEKAVEMGRLRGRVALWHSRLIGRSMNSVSPPATEGGQTSKAGLVHDPELKTRLPAMFSDDLPEKLASLPVTSRVEKHLESVFSTTTSTLLSLHNDDDSSEDFELRLKRATSKIKVITNILGEAMDASNPGPGDGTGSIEDISSLSVRH
ncbi:MAG: hypothetical protein Q9160_006224 [Pyrenula sp. 1 TL-2023]